MPVEFVCFDAARESLEAMIPGEADICFLAVDPATVGFHSLAGPWRVITTERVGWRMMITSSARGTTRELDHMVEKIPG